MSRQSLVSEVMTRDVLTFAPDDNVAEAMQILVDRGIDGGPVVDADGVVVGMLSTGDLIVQEASIHFPTMISILGATIELPTSKRHLDEDLRKALGSTVAEVMQSDPITIGADDTIEEAATLLHDHDISRLPVIGDDGLVGIIARVDVLRAIIKDRAEDQGSSE